MMWLRLLVLLVLPSFAWGQGSALESGMTDEVRDLLQRANLATQSVHACSYKLEIRDQRRDGDGRSGVAFDAEVLCEKVKGGLPRMKVDAFSRTRRGTERTTVVHDGREFIEVDWTARRIIRTPTPFLSWRLGRLRTELWLREFYVQGPFEDEVQARSAVFEKREEIDGVLCDVVMVNYQQQGSRSRWWFGVKDSLPRRVDRIGGRAVRTYEIRNLRVIPVVTPGSFNFAFPEGFDVQDVRRPDAPPHRRLPPRLPPGRDAPAFELLASNGQQVRLRDLRETVVVLQFWNSWSITAKADFPKYKAVREALADRPVVFFGLNCFEDEGVDAGATFQAAEMGYPTLLEGDAFATACRIAGVPAWLVLDGRGRAVASGQGALDEEALRAGIEAAFEKQ